LKVIKIGGKNCSDCIVMKPCWQEIESENPWLKTEFYLAEDSPEIMQKYNVIAVPTFIFLDKKGNELIRLTHIQEKEKLIELINKFKEK
jgi:thioredoxin-related protein